MNTRSLLARCAASLCGGLILLGVAGTAFADELNDDDAVDVSVSIAPITGPGSLSMSVAGTTTTLTENGSSDLVRRFTGTVPTVTVTDTRDPATIPDGAAWYVLGTASDFVSTDGVSRIGAENLGWAPALLDGGDAGLVSEGQTIDPALDGGADTTGLVDQELLATTIDSAAVAQEGSWTANAQLTLTTPASVADGDYTSTLTLSLFE